jgi:hypothetical protein
VTALAVPVHPELAQLASARQSLEASRDLAEVKAIRDVAAAARTYARARKMGAESIALAQEIVNRAERRIGQLLAETPAEPGRRSDLVPGGNEVATRRQETGSRKLSARSQQLAAMPEELFNANAHRPVTKLARIARDTAARQHRARTVGRVTEAAGIRIEHCPFSELNIGTGSVDLMLTDPPYLREFLPLWSDLAKHAAQWLKPGAPLIAYGGDYHLPEVLSRLGEHLEYVWQVKLIEPRTRFHIRSRMVNVGSKTLQVFSNGPYQPRRWLHDTLTSGKPDKTLHEWQQSLDPVLQLVEMLTEPGDHVVDPFLGSGTTAAACKQLGRRFTGCDIDPAAVATARERVP